MGIQLVDQSRMILESTDDNFIRQETWVNTEVCSGGCYTRKQGMAHWGYDGWRQTWLKWLWDRGSPRWSALRQMHSVAEQGLQCAGLFLFWGHLRQPRELPWPIHPHEGSWQSSGRARRAPLHHTKAAPEERERLGWAIRVWGVSQGLAWQFAKQGAQAGWAGRAE